MMRPNDTDLLAELLSLWERRRAEGETLNAADLCPGDPELATLLDKKIAALKAIDGLQPQATVDHVTERPTSTETTATIPNPPGYELLGVLGRGGMGVVYRARQLSPSRPVALKMLLAGAHAGPAALARFRGDGEAIARLRHPNIVQIYEAGVCGEQPFFSLEFCDGGSLDQKLRLTPLPPREAAVLLTTLAGAMQAAHDAGVVHRDLKPANVLLLADGTPKITDFGLAKQAGSEMTATGDVMGTPAYMAPEQAEGKKEVGPPTDIYALGATLYECLTGRPPFKAASMLETLRQVREEEPVAPSRLNAAVPRDLETICLMCLRKDPVRRYPTAFALGEDLQRFLDGRPVSARPVGAGERVRLWCRRNPSLALALTAVAASLLIGTGVSVAFGVRSAFSAAEALASAQAEREANILAQKRLGHIERANEILASIFSDLNLETEKKGGPSLAVQIGRRLDQAAELLEADAIGDPRTVAHLQNTLGVTQMSLGHYSKAIPLLQQSLATRRELLGESHRDTFQTATNVATAYMLDGQTQEAIQLLEQIQERQWSLADAEEDWLLSMNNLAVAWLNAHQPAKALPLLERILPRLEEALGPDHPRTLDTVGNLAGVYYDLNQPEKAVPLIEKQLRARERTLGPDHVDTLGTLNNLGITYKRGGYPERGLPLLQRAVEKRTVKLGPDHPDTLSSMDNLAATYLALKQPDKAVPLYREFLERKRSTLPVDDPQLLRELLQVGFELLKHDQPEAAEKPLREALAVREAKQPDVWNTFSTRSMLGGALLGQQKYAEAEPLLLTGYEGMKQREAAIPPDARVRLIEALERLVCLYEAWDKSEMAARWRQSLEEARKSK